METYDRRGESKNTLDPRFRHNATDKDMLAKGAILQRDGTYAIAPHIPGGIILNPDLLIKMAEVAKKYNCAAMKVTTSQRIALVGIKKEDIDAVWQDLGMNPGAASGLCVRSVKFCPGITFCKRGQQDSIALGMEIDKRYHGMTLPSKFKIAVSGCGNKCTDAMTIDVGIMGTSKGFTLYVGGNGGAAPRLGQKLAANLTAEQVLVYLDKIIEYYKANGKTNQRIGKMIENMGMDKCRQEIETGLSI